MTGTKAKGPRKLVRGSLGELLTSSSYWGSNREWAAHEVIWARASGALTFVLI
jgi:hypothetical protein